MSKTGADRRTDYAFGPFRLNLPEGWQGSFEDGVHTIASDDHDMALQLSGFERDAEVAMSDLYGMVPEGSEDRSRFTLPSGLDGFAWVDPADDARRMVIRAGTVVLAVTEVPGESPDADETDQVEAILATLGLREG